MIHCLIQSALMELSAVDPWGAPAASTAAATVGSAGPSPPPTVPAPASGPWGTTSTDPWGVASPTSPTTSDPWGGGAPPTIAPPPDPWGETSNKVNNVDPWGSSGKQLQLCTRVASGWQECPCNRVKRSVCCSVDERGYEDLSTFTPPLHSTVSFPVYITDLLHHSVMSPCCHIFSFTHMLSICDEESKHAKSILLLCLNQGFLSSCFYSGLTVAVSQPELSLLLPFCAFLMCKVASCYLSFTSIELQILNRRT